MDLKEKISEYFDFPKKGILFRDFSPILKDPSALSFVVEEFSKQYNPKDVDVFVGIESRGFIVACALAQKYNKGMVLMQVGSFFEAYGVNNKYIQRGHANLIGDIFNIAVTRKGKKKYAEELGNRKIEDLTKKQLIKLHEKYPLMSGMNELVIEKYLRIAIENGYTVVLIEQLEQPTKGMMVRRGVTKIVSPGTFIETSSKDKNNIASIFIEKVMKKKTAIFLYRIIIDRCYNR